MTVGPFSYSSHFACRTEYPTKDKFDNSGRLDLLIQLDDIVVGIESKFFAVFQDNQPMKYMHSIEDVANALKIVNRNDMRHIIYVLCPESRQQEAMDKIKNMTNAAVITWEGAMEAIKGVSEISNSTARIVRDEFIKHLKARLGFVPDYELKFPHYRKSFTEYGSLLHTELVTKLWSYFPGAGSRLSYGKTWVGYYFYEGCSGDKGWFGFVPAAEISHFIESPNGEALAKPEIRPAELIIVSRRAAELSGPGFQKVKLTCETFLDKGQHAWVVNFDETWSNNKSWSEKLYPLSSLCSGVTIK